MLQIFFLNWTPPKNIKEIPSFFLTLDVLQLQVLKNKALIVHNNTPLMLKYIKIVSPTSPSQKGNKIQILLKNC